MKCFIVILTLWLIDVHHVEAQGEIKTKLSIYYETLCKDSKKFIKTQLHPLIESPIGKFVNVELIPYGKANTTGVSGSYKFSCQNGDKECEGNKLHACTLKYVEGKNSCCVIGCSMSHDFPPGQVEACFKERKLDFQPVATCAGSNEGSELLAMNGKKTQELEPKLNFVPWIVFDGVWSQDVMKRSLVDLQSVVCEKIGKENCK